MPFSYLSTGELLDQCLVSQSADGWREFVRRFQPVIAAAILRVLHTRGCKHATGRDIVDDLIQQTYLRLVDKDFRALRKIQIAPEGALPYIRTVATNLAFDYVRSHAAPEPIPEGFEVQAQPCDLDYPLLIQAIEKHVKDCSRKNPDRDSRVFWLYFQTGLTTKAIARIAYLKLSESGVENVVLRLSRCVRQAIAEGLGPVKPLTGREQSFGAVT
jgi:RNA polymerase sigma factor (sigma-70 family)